MMHPTDMEIDEAVKTMKKVIEAAENSNHNGEVALMRAFNAVLGKHPGPISVELNPIRCERCVHWTRCNPDDETAPEGSCACPDWKGPLWLNGTQPTFGYHPATLRRDNCQKFEAAE